MQYVPADQLEIHLAALLRALSVPPRFARIAAQSIVASDRHGLSSHGVRRFPNYVERIKAGAIQAHVTPQWMQRRGAVSILDAQQALGQIALHVALPQVIRQTKRHGIAIGGIVNCEHIGALDGYLRHIITHHLIGIIMTNTPVAMAPLGGTVATIGSNPIGIGVPGRTRPLLIFDGATSATSRGRVLEAHEQQRDIPAHWAIDAQGQATTNPQQALAGALLPAGSLGYGLGLAVSLLTSALWGGKHDAQLPSFLTHPYQPVATSVTIIAIDPAFVGSASTFHTVGEAFITHLKTTNPQARIPGSRRVPQSQVAVPQQVLSQLQAFEQEYHLTRRYCITPYLPS